MNARLMDPNCIDTTLLTIITSKQSNIIRLALFRGQTAPFPCQHLIKNMLGGCEQLKINEGAKTGAKLFHS
jgi:hypothetical protein